MTMRCHFIIIDKLVDLFLVVVFELGLESTPCNFRSGFFPKSNENEATVQKESRCKTLELMISMQPSLPPKLWFRYDGFVRWTSTKAPNVKKRLSPPYDPSLGWRGSKKSALILLSVLLPFSPTPRVLNGRHKQAWKWYFTFTFETRALLILKCNSLRSLCSDQRVKWD